MNNIRKNSMGSIFYYSFNFLKSLFFIVLTVLLNFKLWAPLILIGAYLLISVFYLVKWKKINFTIDDTSLTYNYGIFSVKKLIIPLDKITTVDLSQDLPLRICNLYKIKLDTGSFLSNGAETEIILNKIKATKVKEELLSFSSNELEVSDLNDDKLKSEIFTITTNELIKMAVTNNLLTLGLGIILPSFLFINDMLNEFDINMLGFIEDFIKSKSSLVSNIVSSVLVITLVLSIVLIFSSSVSILFTLFKYHNFKVYKSKEHINIQYGLISTKNYSLPISNINSITYKQTLLRRFLKLHILEISSIGYGDEQKEEAILYPIGTLNKLNEIINVILPDFTFSEEIIPAPKRARFRFFFPTLVYSLTFIIGAFFIKQSLFLLILSPFILLCCYFHYKNAGISYNTTKLLISTGMLTCKKTIIPFSKLESIAIQNNYFQRRKKITNYKFDFHANIFKSIIVVQNLDSIHFRTLEKFLEYN